MISIDDFRKLAMSFPEAVELPHFERTSFRVNKKIFATLDIEKKLACIKLSLTDQDVFCSYDPLIIYPVPNKWGKQGATYIELTKVKKAILKDALTLGYVLVAPAKLKVKLTNKS